jgi:sugar (pentulose or hexulose) kinase
VDQSYFKTVQFNESLLGLWNDDLSHYSTYNSAYHALIQDFIKQQVHAVNLVFEKNKTQKIFVDGGFSKNEIYMKLLAQSYPTVEIYAASVAQASALGAALALEAIAPSDGFDYCNLIHLKRF